MQKLLEKDKEDNGKLIFNVGPLCIRHCVDTRYVISLNLSVMTTPGMRRACVHFEDEAMEP